MILIDSYYSFLSRGSRIDQDRFWHFAKNEMVIRIRVRQVNLTIHLEQNAGSRYE